MTDETAPIMVSGVIPVGRRHADMVGLYEAYRSGFEQLGLPYEIIFVLDGLRPQVSESLRKIQRGGARLVVLRLTRSFGEATALMAGFERAAGSIVVTLPAYHQIEGTEIAKLVGALDSADLAVGRRWPRAGGALDRLRRGAFHTLVGKLTGSRFRDLGCGARALKRRVLEEIPLYGDQHRFLPLLADRQGFRIAEIDVKQSPLDRYEGGYPAKEYAHRALDVLTVLFLIRFTKKPLRFFGMLGVLTFIFGAAIIGYLGIDRLVFGEPLGERPVLLLSSLLVVLGLQLLAIGLLGELIIFTHAGRTQDYQVEEIIESSGVAVS
ncbi:MAG: glycosyltransferase [Gammaproteobacteria bacterium]